jgi:hypothetical protein
MDRDRSWTTPVLAITAARRGNGDRVPLEAIPLQYHNSAESRRLQRIGLLAAPWVFLRMSRDRWTPRGRNEKLCPAIGRAYCVGVSNAISEDLIDKFAPADVRDTVRWLKGRRFVMADSNTDSGTFGSRWVFAREATEVHVTVDRSQWLLDIVPDRSGHPVQYDLLVAAHQGQDYRDCFPQPDHEHAEGLPSQLPPGVSWLHTLPQVLRGSTPRLTPQWRSSEPETKGTCGCGQIPQRPDGCYRVGEKATFSNVRSSARSPSVAPVGGM